MRVLQKIPQGSWLTMGLTAVVALMLWASFGLSRNSAWVPQWVLSITLVLLLLHLASEWRATRYAPVQTSSSQIPTSTREQRRSRALVAAAWLALLLLLTWTLGSAPGGVVFCCAWLRGHAGERWSMSVVFAAVLGITLWLLFTAFLGVGLYSGALWRYFLL